MFYLGLKENEESIVSVLSGKSYKISILAKCSDTRLANKKQMSLYNTESLLIFRIMLLM